MTSERQSISSSQSFGTLSHGLTALHVVCGRAGSREMEGINGEREHDRFGNRWWLSSWWFQVITSKSPDWVLTVLVVVGGPWKSPYTHYPHLFKLGGRWADPQYHCTLRASSHSSKARLGHLTESHREWTGYILTRSNIRRSTWAKLACRFDQAITVPTTLSCPPCVQCENSEALAAGRWQNFSESSVVPPGGGGSGQLMPPSAHSPHSCPGTLATANHIMASLFSSFFHFVSSLCILCVCLIVCFRQSVVPQITFC